MGILIWYTASFEERFLKKKTKSSKARMKSALILLSLTMMVVGWTVDAKYLPYDEADQEMETNDLWSSHNWKKIKGSPAQLTCFFTCVMAKYRDMTDCRSYCGV